MYKAQHTERAVPAELEGRLIRHADMRPCKTAFIDARTPGSEHKENFCLIGAGVAENPDQVVHIPLAHGFDVGAARQPGGCKNSHHSHDTEEVFVVHSGRWLFTCGAEGGDGRVELGVGDTISIPTQVFRGFENIGDGDGTLFAVLGLNADGSAGSVIWAPYVFERAAPHGLVLLEDGRLIDTTKDALPEDGTPVKPTGADDLHRFRRLDDAQLRDCVASAGQLDGAQNAGLGRHPGVRELAVLGAASPAEGFAAGILGWPHRFQLRRLQLEPQAEVPSHRRAEEEVLIVHRGTLQVRTPGGAVQLGEGDLLTVPVGLERAFASADGADLIVIRRGDRPQAAH